MDIEFGLNKIYFIVSLDGQHRQSAEDLYNYYIKELFQHCDPELHSIDSKEEFITLLHSIACEIKPGQFPLIHIESHGLEVKNGLSLVSHEEVLWEELRPIFTEINVKSCNNLTLAISACSSARIINELIHSFTDSIDSRAPFFCFLGTEGKIEIDYLIKSFPIFYKHLSEAKNWTAATTTMNEHTATKFRCDVCYHILMHWFHEFANTWVKERMQKIAANPALLTEVYCDWYVYTYNKACSIEAIPEIIASEQFYLDFFNKRLEDYLVVTDCPDMTKGRFPGIKSLGNFEKSVPAFEMIRRN